MSGIECESYHDCIGNEVRVGDLITYPGRSGSSLWMNFGKVTKITKNVDYHSNEYFVVQVLRPILSWTRLENSKLLDWKKVSLQCIDRHVKLFGWQNLILKELFEKEI